MNAVISVALPVFAIIAAGYAAGRVAALSGADSQALNRFVFRIAMPAALFALAANATPPGPKDAGIAIAYATAALLVMFGAYAIAKRAFRLTGPEAGAFAFTSCLGNAVFLGLPIALNIEGWARPFIVLMLIEGTMVIALGAAMMAPREKSAGPMTYLRGPLTNPLVVAMLAGFAYSAFGPSLSGPVAMFFDYLGRAAGPAALVSLGVFFATHDFPKMGDVAGRVGFIAAAKMCVLPAIAFSVAYLLGVSDPAYIGALALFVLVPSGVSAFVIASQYGVSTTESAAAVFVTTMISVLTITAALALFAQFSPKIPLIPDFIQPRPVKTG